MKVYFVMRDGVPIEVFMNKMDAHCWAEDSVGNITVHAATYQLV